MNVAYRNAAFSERAGYAADHRGWPGDIALVSGKRSCVRQNGVKVRQFEAR